MEDLPTFNKKKRAADKPITQEEKEKRNKEKNEKGWKNMVNFKNELKNEKFEFYYKTQLGQYFPTPESWETFLAQLKEKLPCVFRVSKAHPFHKDFLKLLLSDELLKSLLGQNDPGIKIFPKSLTNFPEWKDLVYHINIPRMELKKNESLSKFHKFIQKSVDSGLISRQEAVSMIPPMLMQCKPTDKIFDMCAAPGSKTAQFLEVFYENFNFLNKKTILNDTGFVLANDNNPKRAYMMVHQLKRLNTAGMVVIAHDAQFFPTIYTGANNEERVLFDKILADVPCSSDAVMRKLPHKWKNWSTKDSFSLHKLQIQILKRGINLLKVGGYIIYSTCSLNPIEDEAVVAEILKTQGKNGELEIVDMTSAFNGTDIKPHHGLSQWKVFVEDKNKKDSLIEIPNKDDPLYQEYKDTIEPTCFPPTEEEVKKMNLSNCIRLFPHDSDTSGFFITLIKKVSPLSSGTEKPSKKTNVNEDKGYEFMKEKYPKELQWIVDYYGIDSDFPLEQLTTQSTVAKKICFVSKGVCDLLKADKRHQLKLQNAGVKLFKRNKAKADDENYCLYRICQDGLMYALPFMHKKVHYVDTEFFKFVLTKKDVAHEEIKNEKIKEEFKKAPHGCVVLVNMKKLPENSENVSNEFLQENFIDAICCYNSYTRLTTMINKEHQHVFDLKYGINA